jgi:hypothetical protein
MNGVLQWAHQRVSSTNQEKAPSEPRPAEQLKTPAPEHRKDPEERVPSPPPKHADAHDWLTLRTIARAEAPPLEGGRVGISKAELGGFCH